MAVSELLIKRSTVWLKRGSQQCHESNNEANDSYELVILISQNDTWNSSANSGVSCWNLRPCPNTHTLNHLRYYCIWFKCSSVWRVWVELLIAWWDTHNFIYKFIFVNSCSVVSMLQMTSNMQHFMLYYQIKCNS